VDLALGQLFVKEVVQVVHLALKVGHSSEGIQNVFVVLERKEVVEAEEPWFFDSPRRYLVQL
jgi:hypothetical protein